MTAEDRAKLTPGQELHRSAGDHCDGWVVWGTGYTVTVAPAGAGTGSIALAGDLLAEFHLPVDCPLAPPA